MNPPSKDPYLSLGRIEKKQQQKKAEETKKRTPRDAWLKIYKYAFILFFLSPILLILMTVTCFFKRKRFFSLS